jgi:hypothetical protein
MKKFLSILFAVSLGAAALAGCGGYDRELLGDPQPKAAAATAEAEPEAFYTGEPPESLDVGMFSDLKFYGSWFYLGPFGWVWRPIVGSDWAPFLYGHWVWTSYGWMWVSYDPFGWAAFHYGFWTNDFTLGWVWIPDYQWSPCRVDWIIYDDYICWSPVPPPGVRFKDPWDADRYNPWVAVRGKHFVEPEVARYKEPPKFKVGYSDRTLRRSAPDSRDIERIRGKTLATVDVGLERTVMGEHEFARVTLPPEQQQIVEQHRAQYKAPSSPPAVKDSGTQPAPEKSKKSSGTKTTGKKETEKPKGYKESAKEEKSKEKGENAKEKKPF